MIYFTTFIFTLLLSHIARATPACAGVAYPEELYDPTYADAQTAQQAPIIATCTEKYDNKFGATIDVACNTGPHGLASRYPHFKDIPHFPYIGGAWFVKWGSEYCGTCWKLTNVKNHKSVYITLMDHASTGFAISKMACEALGSGGKPLEVEAGQVPAIFCEWK